MNDFLIEFYNEDMPSSFLEESVINIKDLIKENNFTSLKDMGALMKIIKEKFRKNLTPVGLVILIIFTGISTTFFNYKKEVEIQIYNLLLFLQ